MPYRDPRETITRTVLRYPADGDEPYFMEMEFSTAGAAAHQYTHWTTALDLRTVFGKYTHLSTRVRFIDVLNQVEDPLTEGEYCMYHNIDPKLPKNLSVSKVLGIDLFLPQDRPFWRGDVLVAKSKEWPEPLLPGKGAHKDWDNLRPYMRDVMARCLRDWYHSNEWKNSLQDEIEFSAFQVFLRQ